MAKTSIKQTGMYTKSEVAKMIFPHLPARQGWKKISLAFEGNEMNTCETSSARIDTMSIIPSSNISMRAYDPVYPLGVSVLTT